MNDAARRAEAEALTEELVQRFVSLAADIATAWRRRYWEPLGYGGWREYCEHMFAVMASPEFRETACLLAAPGEGFRQIMAGWLVAAGLPANAAAVAVDVMQPPDPGS